MAEPTLKELIAFLEHQLGEMTTRKGAHSTIAKTLKAALSGRTYDELQAGRVACDHFEKHYEQLTLGECRIRLRLSRARQNVRRSELEKEPKPQRVLDPKAKAMKEWGQQLEQERATLRKKFAEVYVSDGIDFARPDRLSTSGKRHLIAKNSRRKPARPEPPKPGKSLAYKQKKWGKRR